MSYGFQFYPKWGKPQKLDDINPAIYVEKVVLQGAGDKDWSKVYPEFQGLCDVFAILERLDVDNPFSSGPNVKIQSPSDGEISISIRPNGSAGANAAYIFTIFARSKV